MCSRVIEPTEGSQNIGFNIFYSWQSDAPAECNRKFIRRAINIAVEEISPGGAIVDSPRVEDGMEGVSGTPEVATIMFRKIDKCDLFIGDVTLVGVVEPLKAGRGQKKTANPNVLLELGYAAAKLGWDRVICVINEHYGSRHDQPFDVRNRRFPIDYSLGPNAMPHCEGVQEQLAKWLRIAIETAQDADHEGVKEAINRLDIHCLHVCDAYKAVPFFGDLGQDDENRDKLAAELDVSSFRAAIPRMLDLGLITTRIEGPVYAYHWTYRGMLALRELERQGQLLHPRS